MKAITPILLPVGWFFLTYFYVAANKGNFSIPTLLAILLIYSIILIPLMLMSRKTLAKELTAYEKGYIPFILTNTKE